MLIKVQEPKSLATFLLGLIRGPIL
eukprot:COSAG02_NODE_25859_length_647_cov_0.848540_2_plen_24_part_01